MTGSHRSTLTPRTIWVLVCNLLNASGWLLSAADRLDVAGYCAVFIAAGIACAIGRKRFKPRFSSGFRPRRFKRLFPLAYAVVAILALLGGIIHAPANYDALAYRTPRVLHWLAESQWHWIHTDFQRLNTRGGGFEWLTAPLIVFTGTDRLFFLINAISFLLLPGLSFRLLKGLGVRGKVAWHWMWILPTGYCYILQAGSIGNDLFGATLALIAVDLALQASRNRSIFLGSLSVLAAALATSVKSFNLLLFFPWMFAMLPNVATMAKRPWVCIPVGFLAVLVSIVPTSVMNHRFSGDWRGMKAEPVNLGTGSPVFHLGINALLLGLHHANPPVNPLAGTWNRWTDKNVPESWQQTISQHFEPSAVTFKLGEMQMEESAGLGFGVALLLIPVLFAKHRRSMPDGANVFPKSMIRPENLVPIGAGISVVYFLSQSGLGCPGRYLASFYILLLAPMLRLPRASGLLQRYWWKCLACLSFLLAALLLIVTPPRPLWPAITILKALKADVKNSGILSRAWTVYSVYGERSAGFSPVRNLLPSNLNTLGLVTFDDPETSLWQPFGSIRIKHVTRADDARLLRTNGIEYVLVSEYILKDHHKSDIAAWCDRFEADVISSFDLRLRASRGPTTWHIARIRPDVGAPVPPAN